MEGASVTNLTVSSAAYQVRLLVQELKCADALEILFGFHKNNLNQWIELKNHLLSTSSNHREFSFISTLLECSSKQSISESSRFVPGICRFGTD